MKLFFVVSFSVLLLAAPAAKAFIGPAVVPRQTTSAGVGVRYSKAKEHLEEMSEKWNHLKVKEKEIEAKQDPAAAMDFAVEMLETAIEHIHSQEEVEEEHVVSVHEALMKVLNQENALESAAVVAHHDAEDADGILNNYDTAQLPEDREKRRELTVADLAHHVEDYAKERLRQAKREEMQMKEEEEEAKRELEKLKWNEETLKEVLDELKSLKREKERNDLKL